MLLDKIVLLVLIVVAIPVGWKCYKSEKLPQSTIKKYLTFVGVVIGLRVLLQIFAGLYTEYLWFAELNYASVFTKSYFLKLSLFVVGFLVSNGFIGASFRMAFKNVKPVPKEERQAESGSRRSGYGGWSSYDDRQEKMARWMKISQWFKPTTIVIQVVLALFFALVAMGSWKTILLFLNQVPFNRVDPIYGKDIAFYIFNLPFLGLIRDWLTALVIASCLFVGGLDCVLYLRASRLFGEEETKWFLTKVVDHLTVLLGLFFLTRVFDNLLVQPYQILIQGSSSAVPAGAGYVDVNLRLPLFRYKAVLMGMLSLVLFFDAFVLKGKTIVDVLMTFFKRKFKLALALTVVLAVVLGWFFEVRPMWVQGRSVGPAGPKMEAKYIRYHIEQTRDAYGLNKVKESEFTYSSGLSQAEYQANDPTLAQARVMDWRIGLEHAGAYEEGQTYFNFNDVDIDRYDGKEYMLAARELDTKSLEKNARTWSNSHLQYTHGEGYVVFEASKTDAKGEPAYVVKDLPLTGPENLKTGNGAIYFGELTKDWIIVNTGLEEIGTSGNYKGQSGIPLTFFNRLMFAVRFGDWDLLVSGLVGSDSRILFRRAISDRISSLAPFLQYDTDPYFVVDPNELFWIDDAFTFASGWPYSAKTKGVIRQEGQDSLSVNCNYIRNSVKAVVDAYEGKVWFFVVDQEDPIIQAWSRIFPELFKPMTEMPSTVKQHLRYAEDLFMIQAEKLEKYHRYAVEAEKPDTSKVDPLVTAFQSGENLWDFPHENYKDAVQEVEPRHVWMRLPGETKNEFVLVLPFARKNSENLISWLAGCSDVEHYGELNVLNFPRGVTVVGPMQAESAVKTDPKYTKELALWSSQTSKVFWGNIISLPVLGEKSGSVVYVIPIFIQDQKSNIPKLASVALYANDEIIFKGTLEEALDNLYGRKVSEIQLQPSIEGEDLAAKAVSYFQKAQECAGVGDWECFGQQMKLLGEALIQLESQKK